MRSAVILTGLQNAVMMRGFYHDLLNDVRRVLQDLFEPYVEGARFPEPFRITATEWWYPRVLTVLRRLREWGRQGDDVHRIDVQLAAEGRRHYRTWAEFAHEWRNEMERNRLVEPADGVAYESILSFVQRIQQLQATTRDIGREGTAAARRQLANDFIRMTVANAPEYPPPAEIVEGPVAPAGPNGHEDEGFADGVEGHEDDAAEEEPAEGVPAGPVVQGRPLIVVGRTPEQLESQASNVPHTVQPETETETEGVPMETHTVQPGEETETETVQPGEETETETVQPETETEGVPMETHTVQPGAETETVQQERVPMETHTVQPGAETETVQQERVPMETHTVQPGAETETVQPETETVQPETETVQPETETVQPETETVGVPMETHTVQPEAETVTETVTKRDRRRRRPTFAEEDVRAKKARTAYNLRSTPARDERLKKLKNEEDSKRKVDKEAGGSSGSPRKRSRR